MENLKSWYKSRLIWSGIAKIFAGVCTSTASFLTGDMEAQTFITGIIMAIWGVYDVITRFDTNLGIKK